MGRINWLPRDMGQVSIHFLLSGGHSKGYSPSPTVKNKVLQEETKCPSLKTLLEKGDTHQGGGGDKLGAGVHFQGMRGCGRKAGITEAAL